MANKKFSEFTLKTDSANVDFLVGYDGTDNVRIAPDNLGGGGASDLNGLSDVLIDGTSAYFINIPAGLSGNPADNLVIGSLAGNSLTTGSRHTIIGHDAGSSITTSGSNTIYGYEAAKGMGAGSDRNVVIGDMACRANAGDDNVVIGSSAGTNFTSAVEDTVVIGSFAAGIAGTSASQVIAIGSNAGRVNTASANVSIGYQAGYSNTSGTSNTNVGYQAGRNNTTGQGRTMIGDEAGTYHTGSQNTGIGRYACRQGTGIQNTAVGYGAMVGNMQSSDFNTVVGYNAMSTGGSKDYNVVVGREAGRLMTSGSNNTILGSQAGDNLTTGSNNILIGYDATASAVGVSNEITLGDANITALRCQVQTISSLSDSRDKTNIQPSPYGLDLISQLQPVTFDWNMRDGAKVGQKDLGFIAQELQEVDDENLQLVYDSNPDRLEASYGRLIPVLVQAIKELKAEVELLKNK